MDRRVISLNEGWKFHYGDIPQAWYKGFDDTAWQTVFLPHDWSVHMPFEQTNSSGTGYLAGGIGWYRVRFTLPEAYAGCRVRVVFDGIYKNSRIWCNSYHLGKRPYGYTEISYDITDLVTFGGTDNEISVRVCHTDLADSRWFTGSGIYRKAYLVIEEPVHTAWHGVVFHTLKADSAAAEVEVLAELVNDSQEEVSGLVCSALQAKGETAAVLEAAYCLKPSESRTVRMSTSVENPRLWSCEDPQLYTLVTTLKNDGGRTDCGDGCAADVQRVGIRTFVFDADKGFFLNGEETKFKGVCVHHDGGCLGAAMYKEVWLRRLLKLKAAGCNAIRTSHNPHMPELYELCDELGFLVMDEAFDEWENPKNKWSTGHNVYPPRHEGYAEDFPQWHERDLTDMIRRDRNHPCIVMWSIGNEIDYPNDPYCHPLFESMTGNNDANKPASERQYDSNKPNAERLAVIARRLAAIVRQNDTTVPVTLAAAFPELSSRIGFLDPLDVVGYNYKEHLYAEDHRRFPDKPFLGSENGHSYPAWRAVADNPYISGQFLWTGIDYLGEAHGWPVHGSPAGILDLAGFEKPGYLRRKAFWSAEPAACLLTFADDGDQSRRRPLCDTWDYEPGQQIVIRCFTNQPYAELYINGRSLGRQEALTEEGCFEWTAAYEPGTLRADCGRAQTQIATPQEPVRLQASVWTPDQEYSAADAGQKEAAWISAEAVCAAQSVYQEAKIMQVEISLLDARGRRAAQDLDIRVEVSGGTLLGLENGNVADLTPYCGNHRRTWNARLIAYVRPEGKVQLRISCAALGEECVLG